MHTKSLGIHRMVLSFSFLPLQALERSIVYKLYLKYSPSLQLGSHLRHSEEATPPSVPSSLSFQNKAGRRGRAVTKKEARNGPVPPSHVPLVPGAPILQWKELASSGIVGPDRLVDP